MAPPACSWRTIGSDIDYAKERDWSSSNKTKTNRMETINNLLWGTTTTANNIHPRKDSPEKLVQGTEPTTADPMQQKQSDSEETEVNHNDLNKLLQDDRMTTKADDKETAPDPKETTETAVARMTRSQSNVEKTQEKPRLEPVRINPSRAAKRAKEDEPEATPNPEVEKKAAAKKKKKDDKPEPAAKTNKATAKTKKPVTPPTPAAKEDKTTAKKTQDDKPEDQTKKAPKKQTTGENKAAGAANANSQQTRKAAANLSNKKRKAQLAAAAKKTTDKKQETTSDAKKADVVVERKIKRSGFGSNTDFLNAYFGRKPKGDKRKADSDKGSPKKKQAIGNEGSAKGSKTRNKNVVPTSAKQQLDGSTRAYFQKTLTHEDTLQRMATPFTQLDEYNQGDLLDQKADEDFFPRFIPIKGYYTEMVCNKNGSAPARRLAKPKIVLQVPSNKRGYELHRAFGHVKGPDVPAAEWDVDVELVTTSNEIMEKLGGKLKKASSDKAVVKTEGDDKPFVEESAMDYDSDETVLAADVL